MKRFFKIFAICLASLVVVLGASFGIMYLTGSFEEEIINPEKISFEFESYETVENFQIKVTTTTENVTVDNITLSFGNGVASTPYGANHITDGVIIVPKNAKINEPINVKLATTANDGFVDENNAQIEWIAGGISNLVATSECVTTEKATTQIFVDVPVYDANIFVINGDMGLGENLQDQSYKTLISDNYEINAGETIYMGIKYSPARSQFKYSKISSDFFIAQYFDEIKSIFDQINAGGMQGLNYTVQDFYEFLNSLDNNSIKAQDFVDMHDLLNSIVSNNLIDAAYVNQIN